MEPTSQVLEASVRFEGKTYTATYFVENGIIHAHLFGKNILAVVGPDGAEEAVQKLLLEHLLERSRAKHQ